MKKFSSAIYSEENLQTQIENLEQENLRLKQENRKLQQLVLLDPLTRIANRGYFEQSLQQEYKNAVRCSHPLGLLMIDLDRFKQYNDTHGHLAGDRLLIKIALALKETLHRPKDMLFRYGGEEFVCLLPNTNVSGVKRVAQNLIVTARLCDVTISIGAVSVQVSPLNHPQELVEAADRAMYQAKLQGRDRVVLAK